MHDICLELWDWSIFRQGLYNRAFRKSAIITVRSASGFRYGQICIWFQIRASTPGFCYEFHSFSHRCQNQQSCMYKHTCPCGRGFHTLYTCRTAGKPSRKCGPTIQSGSGEHVPTNSQLIGRSSTVYLMVMIIRKGNM